jgi:hypothetical protein
VKQLVSAAIAGGGGDEQKSTPTSKAAVEHDTTQLEYRLTNLSEFISLIAAYKV